MKARCTIVLLAVALALLGCGEYSLTHPRYNLQFPPLPPLWQTILGEPDWQVEWVDTDGKKQALTTRADGKTAVSLPQTWASPVTAHPFWPKMGINPGVFRPAGAIFPFDASGGTLHLSWQGGVEATFFWELARHSGGAETEEVEPEPDGTNQAASTARAAVSRLPWNFNWPRFRRLFNDDVLNAEFRADPWLADWPTIAERTVRSGFNRTSLKPEERSALEVPVNPGPWIGTSPFAAPLYFEGVPVFPVRPAVDTWVSAAGLLRANSDAWMFLGW